MARVWRTIFLALITLSAARLPCDAQEFPSRPIQLVVPFPAGGPSDIYTRQIEPHLSELLRVKVFVDNKPGSFAGAESVIGAAPDGHTLLIVSNTQTALESLVAKKSYYLERDFLPVASINHTDLVMTVPAALPVKTLAEFISLAQSKPKAMNYGSSGPGSPYHLAGEFFKLRTRTDLVHIPYRSLASAREDLIAGQLHMIFDAVIPANLEQLRRGTVKALAITGRTRSPILPEVPTFAEQELPEFEAMLWLGVMAPRSTPGSVVKRLNSEFNAVLSRPDLAEMWVRQGAVPMRMDPAQFAKFVEDDIARWAGIVRSGGVRAD